MVETFLTSDHHFGYNMMKFADANGIPARPFASVEEMDDTLVENFNAVVKSRDKVYFLGDAIMRRKSFPVLSRLNCKNLVLVRGNHDIFNDEEYRKYFTSIYGVRVFSNMILSHIPIHPNSVGRYGTNVHGHMHKNFVLDVDGNPDPRYINVCVEQTNYTPISLNVVQQMIKDRTGGK